MTAYTTKQGDKWDGIAYTQLGDVAHTDKLMLKNQRYLDYYIFPAGIVLELPEITVTAADTDSLPPWKRVST